MNPDDKPRDSPGPADERRSVARAAGVVSTAVLGSRLIGLVREQIFAAHFGAGFLNDAFQVGFRIPNTLRDLFAEGALSVAFVKTFTDYLEDEEKGEEAAWRLASLLMNALAVVLSVVVVLGVVFSPQIVRLIAAGFSPEKAELATTLMRIMFPFILLVALAAVAMGVLNSRGRFGVPASATTLFNVGSIVAGLACAYWLSGGSWEAPGEPGAVPDARARWAITGMAVGTLVGGALQFLIQVPSLMRVGFRFRPEVSFVDPGVRRVMRLMGPALVGAAAVQINVLVNTLLASPIDGAPSWLSYAFRLMQFPIGLFGVAVGTATLPAVSRLAARGDLEGFRSTLSSSLGLVFFLTVPSACGLAVLARPIIALIYERGAFDSFDTEMTAAALVAYSAGLAGYAAVRVLAPAFYALDDARTPMLVSLTSIALNAAAGYLLRSWLAPYVHAHTGLALATSLVALANFGALALLMRRRAGGLHGRRVLASLGRIALASLVLSAVSYSVHLFLSGLSAETNLAARLAAALVPVAAGALAFVAAARLLCVEELSHALRVIAERLPGREGVGTPREPE